MHSAEEFAARWIEDWNAHDLEAILSHYADDIEFTSPRAREIVPASGGIIRGKEALRSYWSRGLSASPGLHFFLDQVLETVSGTTLLYTNHRSQRVAETFFWNEQGLVVRASASYGRAPGSLRLAMLAQIPPEGMESFLHYEEVVLPLLDRYQGQIHERHRSTDGTREIHILSFPDEQALSEYRNDPTRISSMPKLEASRAQIEIFPLSAGARKK